MKTYEEVINHLAIRCYDSFIGGAMDIRPSGMDLVAFIYNSPYVDRDVQEAFNKLIAKG